MPAERDRDPAGRARNARPRDGLGRPLPRGQAGVATMPDDLAVTGAQAAALADRLLREGRPFHAHEVLEAAWKNGPAAERDLWQGLAQIAVGLTHAHRGNARGAVTLLRRGARRVRDYTEERGVLSGGEEGRPFGMNAGVVAGTAEDLAGRMERNGLASLAAADLNPGLLG